MSVTHSTHWQAVLCPGLALLSGHTRNPLIYVFFHVQFPPRLHSPPLPSTIAQRAEGKGSPLVCAVSLALRVRATAYVMQGKQTASSLSLSLFLSLFCSSHIHTQCSREHGSSSLCQPQQPHQVFIQKTTLHLAGCLDYAHTEREREREREGGTGRGRGKEREEKKL